jgi:hypothetical protein
VSGVLVQCEPVLEAPLSLRSIPLLLALAGCFGGFRLTTTVWEFNRDVSDSIVVQEVVFLAFVIVPVYGATTFIDAIILNTIEAFTGENPIGAVDSEDGTEVAIDGHPRRLRRAARNLVLEDGNGKVATAEFTADGGMVVESADGARAEIAAADLASLQDAYAAGGKPALATALAGLLDQRVALAP